MKINRKSEKEILEVYNAYWDGYLKGDVKSMASLLDDGYTQIGSAEGEVFFNKKGAVKFLRDTIHQVAGKVDMRNRVIKLEPSPTNILITELTDLYVLIEGDWVFHSKFRASSMMQKKRGGWKITHQHSSFPDLRAQEGENIAIGKIAMENLQLRDAVKRRTVELEQGKRELEIEAALERVRAQAMSMRKPDELAGVSEIIFNELKALGFADIRNTEIIINKDAKKSITSYYYSDYGVTGTIEVDYTSHPTVKTWMEDLKKTRDSFVAVRIAEKEMKAWRKYRESLGYLPDPKLNKVKTVEYYSYSIGLGALSVSSFKPISQEQLTILERFKNVFGLAYRRYADVAQAEAQAREAQIEAALERVRSRSMAMHKSDELKEVIQVVYEQFTKLKLHVEHTGFIVDYKEREDMHIWLADQYGSPFEVSIPYFDSPHWNSFIEAKEKGTNFFANHLTFKEKNRFYRDLFKLIPGLPEESRHAILQKPGLAISTVLLDTVGLYIENLSGIPYTDEENATLMRFGKVFQQTYTRFLDLQKAEAQAREAQIEAALERVRSRTMAMHKPDELLEAAELVQRELTTLGITSMNVSYAFVDDKEKSASYYSVNPVDGKVVSFPFVFPHTETKVMRSILSSWKKQEPFHVIDLDEDATLKHQTYIGEHVLKQITKNNVSIPFSVEAFLAVSPKKAWIYTFNFTNGYLFNIGGVQLTKAQEELVLRFTKVFNQTYTRFLDLQKAEAQAREAKIEMALERVRSRTMAMQRSEELGSVAEILFKQVAELGIHAWSAGFNIWQEGNESYIDWVTNPSGGFMEPYTVDLTSHPVFREISNAKKRGEDFHVFDTSGKALEETYALLMSFAPKQFEGIKASGISFPTRQINHYVYGAQVGLMFITPEPCPEAWDMFKRFGKVFEQTYTRFLDLQQAEAQAGEARIQLALERVRARTMAMQHSDELADTSHVLERQVAALGLKTWGCAFHIFRENDSLEYSSNADGVKPTYVIPRTYIWQRYYEACQRGETLIIEERAGEACTELYEYMAAMPIVGEELQKMKAAGIPFPTYQVEHAASFKYGYLLFITFEQVPTAHDIFKRFAKVFEQSYTRFLDLQKSEAQARESKIEASLERVRSKTMAMHDSSDVVEATSVVFMELHRLGIETLRCGILIIDESQTMEIWAATRAKEGQPAKIIGTLDMTLHPLLDGLFHAWKNKKESYDYDLLGQDRINYYQTLSSIPIFQSWSQFMNDPDHTLHACIFNAGALYIFAVNPLSNEDRAVMKRFTVAFSQTFLRYRDLQKAEAQAREALIEASLERVRSKTMAMHNSQDVGATVATMFDELVKLGVGTNRSGILVFSDTTKTEVWTAKSGTDGSVTLIVGNLDTIIHPMLQAVRSAWKSRKDFFSYELKGEDIKNYYNEINNYPGYPTQFDLGSLPAREIHTDFYFPEGAIFAFTADPIPADASIIFKRFAGVFGQTYRRYLDLQKAEAQAREATIEASLEKVRGRAMAMHNSNDLTSTAGVVFTELRKLGINPIRAGVGLLDKETGMSKLYAATATSEDMNLSLAGTVDMSSHPFLIQQQEAWLRNENFSSVLSGPDLKSYYKAVYGQISAPLSAGRDFQHEEYSYYFPFSAGLFFVWTEKPYSDNEKAILIRFKSIVDLTFRRYLDLQRAETQARQAQIEAAMEKVRARSSAMQKPEELVEVAEVLRKEMGLLGVEELETSSIYIPDEATGTTECWYAINDIRSGDKKLVSDHMTIRLNETWVGRQMQDFNDSDQVQTSVVMQGENRKEWINYCAEHSKGLKGYYGEEIPERTYHLLKFSNGYMGAASPGNISTESWDLLKRAAAVFSFAYTRFLDLQKAEAQAREARIELALERVRASAMAMHKSEDVGSATLLVFDQLNHLGITSLRCGIAIPKDADTIEFWAATTNEKGEPVRVIGTESVNLHAALQKAYQTWKAKDEYQTYVFEGDDLKNYYKAVETSMLLQDGQEKMEFAQGGQEYLSFYPFTDGWIYVFALNDFSDHDIQILVRFAKVFDLTYRRFQDLLRAEQQGREAQIELAIERVRARAMAMHSSDELSQIVATLFEELIKLDLVLARCIIWIFDQETLGARVWMTNSEDKKTADSYFIKQLQHPYYKELIKQWRGRNPKWVYDLNGNDKETIDKLLLEETELSRLPEVVKTGILSSRRTFISGSFNNFGLIEASGPVTHSEEQLEILYRFGKVFDQNYRRFLDLQKAEAQAREATIEASLERVRASAMAMHSSEDVVNATGVLFKELHKLGIENMRCGILIIDEDRTMEVWSVTNTDDGKTVRGSGRFNMDDHPLWRGLFTNWKQKDEFYYYHLAGEDKKNYYRVIATKAPKYFSAPLQELPDQNFQGYNFPEGTIWTFSMHPHSEEDKQVLKRFTAVFSLTFRRYQDLKKAEEQAREALLEASLERVRGKAMAMHSSADLAATIGVFYHELESMSLTPRRVGVGLINKETRVTDVLTINTTLEGNSLEILGQVKLAGHPAFEGMFNNWLEQKEFHLVLRDQEIKTYNEFLRSQIFLPELPVQPEQHGYWFAFPDGSVYTWAEKELNEDELRIYRRFTTVLSLTYKRYKDLKDSEARALIAIREASLDRVRAGIASMRTAEDLNHITPLIWRELKALGLPFFRCGLIIANEKDQIADFYLSTPENKPLAALHLRFDSEGTIKNAMAHWREQKVYTDHWDREQFAAFAKSMIEQGQIQTANTYQGGEEPPESLTLQFMPFVQGMLYVGSAEPLSESHIELAKALAEAFSTAYARYEDFTKLETAKLQIEKTLVDLKQTQAQLVQSEKMASLGELTAGIAHEIQNPLNFVNNFSEVNKELLEEMNAEIEKGNFDEVKILAKDIIDNEQKINHHGKRADGIVKGMLQHSRSSSGQKEPTDINALADEYLRLAYHGLRAKDKSFNAKFETKFDESIGKVPVIPQDIGRVILNLITNAFYAVTERKKSGVANYEPTVTVSTRKDGNRVLISVMDNGSGIPQKVLDKIFQPFFTTKPTGQGTGLGLSMSYDIVNAHGGDIKVNTKENQGAEFVIALPC